jgi:hypothetical protein
MGFPAAQWGGAMFTLRFVPVILIAAFFAAMAACSSDAEAREKFQPEVVPQVGHSDHVEAVAFSPDGRYVLTGSDDNTLKLWDVATGKELRSFSGHTYYVTSVAFSPDGRFGSSGSQDNEVKLWDLATGRELQSFGEAGSPVAFSPDGRFVLSPRRRFLAEPLGSGRQQEASHLRWA